MGIASSLAADIADKLVVPYPGKMFSSSVAKDDKALCFVINKGYFETDNIDDLNGLLSDANSNTLKLVGGVDKVEVESGEVFRQRVFFKSLKEVLELCKLNGFAFELGDDFHITINSIMNCLDDMKYMEYYARSFKVPIDVWLTNCCIVHINQLLKSMGMYTSLSDRAEKILEGNVGYLDRSPFLISSYSIDDKTSSMFLELDITDKRLFSTSIPDKFYLTYGFTTTNVADDIKRGYFK